MTTLSEPVLIACQFGAVGIVYGLLWLAQRWQRRKYRVGLRRWVGIQLAMWRGRKVQDRRDWNRPKSPRFERRFTRERWTFGWHYRSSNQYPGISIWTRFFGLDWKVRMAVLWPLLLTVGAFLVVAARYVPPSWGEPGKVLDGVMAGLGGCILGAFTATLPSYLPAKWRARLQVRWPRRRSEASVLQELLERARRR